MNLHSMVSKAIGVINPHISAKFVTHEGWSTSPSGKRVPNQSQPIDVAIQCQALTQDDLVHIAGLNAQGEKCSVYLTGQHSGIVRPDGKGGEQFTLADGTIWKVIAVPEQWSDWSKVILCRQT